MIKLQWEELENVNYIGKTHRAKVVGGWLINHTLIYMNETNISTTFVPDINHEWN